MFSKCLVIVENVITQELNDVGAMRSSLLVLVKKKSQMKLKDKNFNLKG